MLQSARNYVHSLIKTTQLPGPTPPPAQKNQVDRFGQTPPPEIENFLSPPFWVNPPLNFQIRPPAP